MACSFREALDKYDLYARARGFTEPAIAHTRRCVTLFDDYLGGSKDVGDINVNDFRRFVADLRQRPQRRPSPDGSPHRLSGTAVNTYARGVKAFFSWLKAEGIIAVNPLASEPAPKKPRTLPKVYSESELKAVFKAVMPDRRNKAIVFLFLSSGLRLTGLALLTVNTLDTGEGSARVMGKGQIERDVPFDGWAAEAVDDYVKNGRPAPKDTDRLFLTAGGRPLSARGIQTMLAHLGRKAGIKERLSPHKLRHTFATLSLKYGGNLEYVKIILGHSDIQTTSDSYLNVASADVKAAHEKFSPLSNLMDSFAGKGTTLQKKRPPEEQPNNPAGQPAPGGSGGTVSHQDRSPSARQKSTLENETSTGAAAEAEAGGAPGDAESRLKPIFRDLYHEHQRKLAILTGELATDIENGNLERRRHPAKAVLNASSAGVNLVGVYHAQNSRLWPFLAQHLDSEFGAPKLTAQIMQAAVETRVNRLLNKESGEGDLARVVREKLVLVSERGTFPGTCDVCRGYFYESSVG
jgi:integrase/recombinase XerD